MINEYPNINKTLLLMIDWNGVPREQSLFDDLKVIADLYKRDLPRIEEFLGTLSQKELQTFIDGEGGEITAIATRGGEPGKISDHFLDSMFVELCERQKRNK